MSADTLSQAAVRRNDVTQPLPEPKTDVPLNYEVTAAVIYRKAPRRTSNRVFAVLCVLVVVLGGLAGYAGGKAWQIYRASASRPTVPATEVSSPAASRGGKEAATGASEAPASSRPVMTKPSTVPPVRQTTEAETRPSVSADNTSTSSTPSPSQSSSTPATPSQAPTPTPSAEPSTTPSQEGSAPETPSSAEPPSQASEDENVAP